MRLVDKVRVGRSLLGGEGGAPGKKRGAGGLKSQEDG